MSEQDLLELAAAWRNQGRCGALATVVGSWGSSPRPPGSQLLVDDSGRFLGSVSGGCIESEVLRGARGVIETGVPVMLEFGVADEGAWSVGLSCGGRIQIYLESLGRMNPEVLSTLLEARRSKLPVALLKRLLSGEQIVIGPVLAFHDSGLEPGVAARALELLDEDRSERLDTASGPVFVQVFNPPFKLILIGAVHIAQPLARIAALAGYEVLIVDPRGAYSGGERFEGLRVDTRWPDLALAEITADRRTALVTMSHDPKLDHPALAWALRSAVSYIGALGSRKTHQRRLEWLARRGFSEADCGRIHAPVGLSIGAVNPAEIAIAIMAEITRARRSKA